MDCSWCQVRGFGVLHLALICTRRVLSSGFAPSSISQPMIFGLISLPAPGRAPHSYVSLWAWMSKLLFIPAGALLVAKRNALAPLVNAAF